MKSTIIRLQPRKLLTKFVLFSLCSIFIIQVISLTTASTSVIPIEMDTSQAIKTPFGVCHGYGHDPVEATNLSNQGVQMSRNDITWAAIERETGVYDFSAYDRFISNITAVGIEPLPILDYGNPVLYGNGFEVYISKEQIPDWLNYVNASISHYKGVIKYWEIWNEPNLDKFWSGTDEEFFNILNLTAYLIKTIDPTLNVISPGISGHDPDYLDRMISYIGDQQFNDLFSALNFHPYSGKTAELVSEKCALVNQVASTHGFTGEIWITEVGLSTQASAIEKADVEWPALWDYQATQVIKTFAQAIAANISRIVWYCYRDGTDKLDGESNFGIQHYGENGWFYKPSGYAFQSLSRLLSYGKYLPIGYQMKLPIGTQSELIWVYHFLTTRNTSVLIFWTQTLADNFQISLVGNDLPFKITSYNYFLNETSESTAINHPFKEIQAPILIEMNYSQVRSNAGINGTPLMIRIQVSYSTNYSILLIIIPLIEILGISLIFLNRTKIIPTK